MNNKGGLLAFILRLPAAGFWPGEGFSWPMPKRTMRSPRGGIRLAPPGSTPFRPAR